MLGFLEQVLDEEYTPKRRPPSEEVVARYTRNLKQELENLNEANHSVHLSLRFVSSVPKR